MCLYTSLQTLTTIAETAQPVRDIEWVKKLNRGGEYAQDPTITLLWFYFELSLQVPLRQPEHAWRSSLLCNNCRQHWSDDQQHERSQRCVQRQGMVLKRILLEIHCKWCFLKCWEITKRSVAAGRLHQSVSCVPKNSKGAWNKVGEHISRRRKKMIRPL